MFERLRAWLGGLSDESAETDESSETDASDGDGSRFVPSPLDRSVRRAHGSGDEETARELERVEEQAQDLESANRRD